MSSIALKGLTRDLGRGRGGGVGSESAIKGVMEYKLKECDMDRLTTRKMLWRRVEGKSQGRGGRMRQEKTKTATAVARLALAKFSVTEWTLARKPGPTICTTATATGATDHRPFRSELKKILFFRRSCHCGRRYLRQLRQGLIIDSTVQYTWDVWEEGDTYE